MCDKNAETIVIMIRETKKKLEKVIGCKFLEDATIMGWTTLGSGRVGGIGFLTVLSKITGKYSRNWLTQIQSSLPWIL